MGRARRILQAYGYLTAALAVGLATLVFLPFREHIDFAHLSWLYLCVVALVAWACGTGPAFLAAVLAFATGTVVVPPFGTLHIAEPLDLIQLVVFFIAASAIGTLTGELRKREQVAVVSEREATALARLASEMAEGQDVDSIADSVSAFLSGLPDVRSAAVWIAEAHGELVPRGSAASEVTPSARSVARRSFDGGLGINLPSGNPFVSRFGAKWPSVDERHPAEVGSFVPLVSSSGIEGVLQVVGVESELDDATASLAVSLSHLLAIFISRARAFDTATRVQGAEEAARVKAVIVSAVSHELKTPLAAAMAGVTDLMSEDVHRDSEDMRTALTAVAGDLDRLQTAISDLLDLSRLQSEEWMPHPDVYEAGEILGDVVAAAAPALRERLVFRVKDRPAPLVFADFTQVSRALRAVLDNAVAYSPKDSPIYLGAERSDDRTLVWIEDRGPGVPNRDKPFVFDRAFRGQAGVRRPGSTGLGLTIARDLVEANAGLLSVEDASPRGTRIVVDLPAVEAQGEESQ